MKKLLSILLAAAMAFCLSGCGNVKETVDDIVSIGGEIISALDDESVGAEQTTASQQTQQTAASTTEYATTSAANSDYEASDDNAQTLDPDGTYTTKDDVALYIYLYGGLPDNFITKKEAQALGWEGGSLEPYAPGMCIGGSHFGNYEGLLPEADGREYTECDIDTLGADSRGAKRIVFSNDGLIYYTDDHYESFTLLYGEE